MTGFLLSYHFSRDDDLDVLAEGLGDPEQKFLLDSGAFSAYTVGAEIEIEAYADFVRRWEHRLEHYMNLDEILDWKASQRNQARLEEMGLSPVPVFHIGSPVEIFRDLCETHDFIAIGNLVTLNKRDPKVWTVLEEIHSIAQDRQVLLHGLGLISWPLARRWPWRSIDSSAWSEPLRYGKARLYNFYEDRWIQFRIADEKSWGKWGWLVREYGFAVSDFAGVPDKERRGALVSLLAAQWAKAEEKVLPTRCYHALAFMTREILADGTLTVSLLAGD